MPDILVCPASGKSFYMEAKMASAQCGQIVLLPDDENQQFMNHSKAGINAYSEAIRSYMNQHFDTYRSAGSRGVILPMDPSIFYGWVREYYGSKNVRFFISKNSRYCIIPLENFAYYFAISAKYRIKRSGTNHPSGNNHAEILGLLSNLSKPCQVQWGNSSLPSYVITEEDLGGRILQGDRYSYLFNREAPGKYAIRRRSNTENLNVLFSVHLKNGVTGMSQEDFIQALGQ